MKKTSFVLGMLGILAIALVFGMTLVSCGGDDPGEKWEPFSGRYICVSPERGGMVIDAGKGNYTISSVLLDGSIKAMIKGTYTYTDPYDGDQYKKDANLIITELNTGYLNKQADKWESWEEAGEYASVIPGGKERFIINPDVHFYWCEMEKSQGKEGYRFLKQDLNADILSWYDGNRLAGIWKMDAPPSPLTSVISVIGYDKYLTITSGTYNQLGNFSYSFIRGSSDGGTAYFIKKYQWDADSDEWDEIQPAGGSTTDFTYSLSGRSLTLSGGTGEAAAFNGKWTRQ